MGFLLSYLMCFMGAFIIQTLYSKKLVKNHISFIAWASFAFLISLWVFDALVELCISNLSLGIRCISYFRSTR